MSITKEKPTFDDIEVIHEEEVEKGDVYYSFTIYDAEADQAIDMVEGEKVYVMEAQDDSDWWLVKKHLTEETGWVPAKILMTESQYEKYVQKKLNEKIDKLPVLESKYIIRFTILYPCGSGLCNNVSHLSFWFW